MKNKDFDPDPQCRGLVWTILVILLVIFIAMQFVGCTSHKSFVDITDEMSDSFQQLDEQQSSTIIVSNDSSSVADFSQTVTTDSSITTEDLDEVVTEHIVETVDSAGNRTTTTDRTTQRKKKTDNTQTSTAQSQQTTENNSVSNHTSAHQEANAVSYSATHNTKNEYTEEKKQKESFWKVALRSALFYIALVILLCIANLIYKYIKGK